MRACPGPGGTGGDIVRVQSTTVRIGNDVVELCVQIAAGQCFVTGPGFNSAIRGHNLP